MGLDKAVRTKGKARGLFALGIQLDEFLRKVFDLGFDLLLLLVPGRGAELGEDGEDAFLAGVFGDFVQGLQADVDEVVVFVNKTDDFLLLAVDAYFAEASKLPNAMIDVDNIVAWLQGAKRTQGDSLGLGVAFGRLVAVVTVKDLVIGVAGNAYLEVYKALAYTQGEGSEGDRLVLRCQQGLEAIELGDSLGGDDVV